MARKDALLKVPSLIFLSLLLRRKRTGEQTGLILRHTTPTTSWAACTQANDGALAIFSKPIHARLLLHAPCRSMHAVPWIYKLVLRGHFQQRTTGLSVLLSKRGEQKNLSSAVEWAHSERQVFLFPHLMSSLFWNHSLKVVCRKYQSSAVSSRFVSKPVRAVKSLCGGIADWGSKFHNKAMNLSVVNCYLIRTLVFHYGVLGSGRDPARDSHSR